ncbi:helix-turn-helix domain-containing protein [Streptococcus suis]|uniref:helix-turn-helix domain-containing protein n=1 Tax=Streptococcus suis TaxID=1307 RepID=UPI001F3CDCDC|nr:helix-turn-helix transcriptional regulator [Streptococcus suis]
MNRLKELRKEKKLTQEELASEIGVSKITILRWENGERQIKPDKAQALADYFGVSVGYLLGYSENPKRYDDEIILTNSRTDRIFTHSYQLESDNIKSAFKKFTIDCSLLLTDVQIDAFASMIAELHNCADYKYFGRSIKDGGVFEPLEDVFEILKQMKKDGYEYIFPDLD